MVKKYTGREVEDGAECEDHDSAVWVHEDDYAELKKERDRLLVLATKHCDTSHHDWDEILNIANDEDE